MKKRPRKKGSDIFAVLDQPNRLVSFVYMDPARKSGLDRLVRGLRELFGYWRPSGQLAPLRSPPDLATAVACCEGSPVVPAAAFRCYHTGQGYACSAPLRPGGDSMCRAITLS